MFEGLITASRCMVTVRPANCFGGTYGGTTFMRERYKQLKCSEISSSAHDVSIAINYAPL